VKARLVIPQSLEAGLRAQLMAAAPLEHGAALLLGLGKVDGGVALFVRKVLPIPPDGFRIQEAQRWAPSTTWLSSLVGMADEANGGVALVHSHPMTSSARRSAADNWADELIAPYFLANLGERPFASLVLTDAEIGGSVWVGGGEHVIEEVRVPGAVLRRDRAATKPPVDHLHDRHVLLFGEDGQRRLSALSTAVVGAGGTGSAVAEQLVRMGVGRVMLIDPDNLEESNVSRVYGSRREDVGTAKVDVVGRFLEGIGSGTRIVRVPGDVRRRTIAEQVVRSADLIFGCTDTHSSRAVLNDIAYQHMIPTLDVGIRVGMGESGPTSAAVEMRVLRPDLPCLWCYDVLDGRRVSEELMPVERRAALEREGYVQGRQPAATIIPYTTLAASLATSRFLAMCTGLSEFETGTFVFDALTFDGWQAKASTSGCVCLERQGLGDARPVWLLDD